MSMPISDRALSRGRHLLAVPLAAAVSTLAACNGIAPTIGGGEMAPRDVAVTSAQLIVRGPEGWCIDESATRDDGASAFVLLGNCAVLSDARRVPQPPIPAVLTAAISAPSDSGTIAEGLSDLDPFFRSVEGRTLLSRSQDADSVEILETRIVGDMFLLHARDTSVAAVPGVQSDYWRAYFDMGSRIATLSVLGLQGREISTENSLLVLQNFAGQVRAANAMGEPVAPLALDPLTVGPVEALPAAGQRDAPLFGVGLFRRILR